MPADNLTSKTSSNSKTPLGSAGSEMKSISYSNCGGHFQDFQNGSLEVVAQVVDFASLPDFQNFHPYRGKPALEVAALPLGEALKTEARSNG